MSQHGFSGIMQVLQYTCSALTCTFYYLTARWCDTCLVENRTCYPTSKKQPPRSVEKDIRPISLTPIVSKIFESIVMKWVDHTLENKIDDKQFGGGVGTSTTDALVEMIHHWCEATDRCGT